jgi:uncharacterized membrane protein
MLLLFLLLIIIDFIYLSIIQNKSNEMIYNIQNSYINIKYISILFCYLFLTFGLYYFIIKENKKPFDAFILGLVIYGVYDTTNYGIFDKWDIKLLFIDILWGGILFYLITFIYYYINNCLYLNYYF